MLKTTIAAFCLCLTTAAKALDLPYGVMGPDVTQEFLSEFHHSQKQVEITVSHLNTYKVLYVPGFARDIYELFYDYYGDQLEWMSKSGLREGINFDILNINGEGTLEENTQYLVRVLEKETEPLIMVTHSKGSADLLNALILRPDLRVKIKGWIALQGAFGGSEVIPRVTSFPNNLVTWPMLFLFRGSFGAARDLSVNTRQAYMETHLEAVREVVTEIPTLSVASWADKADLSGLVRFGYWALSGEKQFQGQANDGMMATQRSLLPFAESVVIEHMDHSGPSFGSGYDRVNLTRALLKMIIKRQSPAPELPHMAEEVHIP